jgi:2-polyprenyl-6-methoxyphenol hydroxylase-like FAD-dependent oxidoreductase
LKPYKFLSLRGWNGESFQRATAQCLTTEKIIEIEADYIIGAEGRHSPIRRGLEIGLKEYSYNHYFLTVSFPAPPTLTEAEMVVKGYRFLGLFPLQKQRVRTALLIKPDEYKTMKRDGLDTFYHHYLALAPELDGYVQTIRSWKEVQLMIPVRHNAEHYVYANCALIGDAAHSVHPMAGEGMNLAIQDADSLGNLLHWMYTTGNRGNAQLLWYEKTRKPRVEYMSELSHQSALVYSYSNPLWRVFRTHVLRRIAGSPRLHYKQILNISGLGMWKETWVDRLRQAGLWPAGKSVDLATKKGYLFTKQQLYPWWNDAVEGEQR